MFFHLRRGRRGRDAKTLYSARHSARRRRMGIGMMMDRDILNILNLILLLGGGVLSFRALMCCTAKLILYI